MTVLNCLHRALWLAALCLTLMASGGGGGSGMEPEGPPPTPSVPDPDPEPEPDPVTWLSGRALAVSTSDFVPRASDAQISDDFALLDSSQGQDAPMAGGISSGLAYLYDFDPADGTIRLFALTDGTSMPGSGTATYSGQADLLLNDASAVYGLQMNARTTVDFAAGEADLLVSGGASGWVTTTSGSGTYSPSGGETVRFDGLEIRSGRLAHGTGSTAAFSGFPGGGSLGGGLTVRAEGVFAGPNAEELGAIATARGYLGEVIVTFAGAR